MLTSKDVLDHIHLMEQKLAAQHETANDEINRLNAIICELRARLEMRPVAKLEGD